jgi:hypothetical protein
MQVLWLGFPGVASATSEYYKFSSDLTAGEPGLSNRTFFGINKCISIMRVLQNELILLIWSVN